MRKLIYIVCLFSVFLIFCRCGRTTVFDECKTIERVGWHKDSVCTFLVEVADTVNFHRVEVIIRNSANYPNQNLWLFIDKTNPDGTTKKDTVQCFLADEYGRWTGSGVGSIFSNSFIYQDSFVYSQLGVYSYTIQQGMRYDYLEGINSVGLCVTKVSCGEK